MKTTGYYFEDNQLKRYFGRFNKEYFKTIDEYINYASNKNIKMFPYKIFRKSKYSTYNDGIFSGKFITFDYYSVGLEVFDNRDFSMYYFKTEDEAIEFIEAYKKDPDCYIQQCYYDGYEGDEIYNVEYIADQMMKDIEIKAFDKEKENKKFCHLILSYLPSDDRRQNRYMAHVKQIKNIKAITPYARIYIIAQNYSDLEYINDPQITYLKKYSEGIGAQRARNELLEFLYNSDYEYGVISDDDQVLAPTESTINFYNELENNTEKFIKNKVDICFSRNMQYEPLRPGDILNEENTNQYWMFYYKPSYWLGWAILRNFKKAYDAEEYQDLEIDPTEVGCYDDMEFCFRLATKGYHCYYMPLFQLLCYNNNEFKSSIFYKTIKNPNTRYRNIILTYKRFMGENENGDPDWEYWNKTYINQPTELRLERDIPVKNSSGEFVGRDYELMLKHVLHIIK